ncbi:SOS response-associated peptidase [Kriegella aquimaris]|uniref:Abasic site processing protein n=1 Tax=Kriegella aquimaris TaxID=192904 RepID=A0A1G9V080_9FLAO|nr:SOS response-associated peptidase [Kriegella aquimaris]SDM65632.1 Putative SOS response-associated peptidase YedK [Kriegella aquimaris]
MCYSTTLDKEHDEVEARIRRRFKVPLEYRPYYYQSAFNHENLYIVPQKEKEEIVPAVWGLVPEYAMKGNISEFLNKNYTNNARAETIFEKRSYKEFPLTNRCLILASGFFEPHHLKNTAYPYFCHYTDNSIFCFAGLYSQIDDEVYSCTIITVEANDFFAEVHNKKKRMPLVLDEEFEEEWLRNDLSRPHIEELMRVGFTTKEFEAYSVTRNLYKPNYERNTPEAIKFVDYSELNQQGSLF